MVEIQRFVFDFSVFVTFFSLSFSHPTLSLRWPWLPSVHHPHPMMAALERFPGRKRCRPVAMLRLPGRKPVRPTAMLRLPIDDSVRRWLYKVSNQIKI
jgi:hypothetical protein